MQIIILNLTHQWRMTAGYFRVTHHALTDDCLVLPHDAPLTDNCQVLPYDAPLTDNCLLLHAVWRTTDGQLPDAATWRTTDGQLPDVATWRTTDGQLPGAAIWRTTGTDGQLPGAAIWRTTGTDGQLHAWCCRLTFIRRHSFDIFVQTTCIDGDCKRDFMTYVHPAIYLRLSVARPPRMKHMTGGSGRLAPDSRLPIHSIWWMLLDAGDLIPGSSNWCHRAIDHDKKCNYNIIVASLSYTTIG